MQKHTHEFTITKEIYLAISSVFVSVVIRYLFNAFLARHLDPAVYGDISIVLKLLNFCVPVFFLGSNLSISRYLPKYLADNHLEKVHGLIRWNIKNIVIAFIAIIIIGLLLTISLLGLHVSGIRSFGNYHPLFYAIWLVPLFSLTAFFSRVMASLRFYFWASATFGIMLYIFYVAIIVSIVPFFNKLDAVHVLFAIGSGCLLLAGFQLTFLLIKTPLAFLKERPVSKTFEWRRASFLMMLSDTPNSSLSALDLVMVELLANNNNDVGIFAAFLAITAAVRAIVIAFDLISIPMISVNLSKTAWLQKALNKLNHIKISVAILTLLSIILFGKQLLAHFGPMYVKAYSELLVFAIIVSAKPLFSFARLILLNSDYQHLLLKITVAEIVIIIIADIILIPTYGILGAIIGYGIGVIASAITQAIVVKKTFNIKTFYVL